MKAENVKGFEKLGPNAREMFQNFLKNFYNAWGLEARTTIQPISVKFCKDSEGTYLRFDYKVNERKDWLHVKGSNNWY